MYFDHDSEEKKEEPDLFMKLLVAASLIIFAMSVTGLLYQVLVFCCE